MRLAAPLNVHAPKAHSFCSTIHRESGYGRWLEAERKLQETPALVKTPLGYVQQSSWLNIANRQMELMGRYMAEIGLTPASRSRLATDQTVGIMAFVAQAELEASSLRTKEALAITKAGGVKLGNPNGAESLRRAGKFGAALHAAGSANAVGFAADLTPVPTDIRAKGHSSIRAIAAELAACGIRTRRSWAWNVGSVRTLVARHLAQ